MRSGSRPASIAAAPRVSAGGRAGRDVACLGAGQLGDPLAGDLLEVADPGERAGRLRHRGHDLRLHERPAGERRAAARVDEGADAEVARRRSCGLPVVCTIAGR